MSRSGISSTGEFLVSHSQRSCWNRKCLLFRIHRARWNWSSRTGL